MAFYITEYNKTLGADPKKKNKKSFFQTKNLPNLRLKAKAFGRSLICAGRIFLGGVPLLLN
ncbi:MAG: hypothetical protein EAZ57_02980 [Cytophagales bacterium]|nr:MAG: hypothetical protein EAZ67_03445 [Cytophagales bacterium]TAF61723.1 MAG: hypothetical protein EAZ57_02980 [Cytophagales bacterium]